MQNKGLLIGVGVFIAVVLAGGYFVLSGSQVKPSPTPTTTATEPGRTLDASEVKEIIIEGKEYSFSPSSITVTKGEKILLTFKNTGRFAHNLTIDELKVSTKTVAGGQSDTVIFTADKSGTFSFFCAIGNHRALGMEGEMEVK